MASLSLILKPDNIIDRRGEIDTNLATVARLTLGTRPDVLFFTTMSFWMLKSSC